MKKCKEKKKMTFKQAWNKGRERLNKKLIRAGLFWSLVLITMVFFVIKNSF